MNNKRKKERKKEAISVFFKATGWVTEKGSSPIEIF
jgi:hypothetical protein